MKLQVAIDRVSLDEAVALVETLDGKVDIIEMGTSLVKDYGIEGMKKISEVICKSSLLIDLKTIDEGAYEFEQGFKFGGDILTVMGASSLETIKACYQVSLDQKKTMMIDLLETEDLKVQQLVDFEEAIFCLHHSIDKESQWDTVTTIAEFRERFPMIKRLAIAGGVNLTQAKKLNQQGLTEIVVVGSNITKSTEPTKQAKLFMEEF